MRSRSEWQGVTPPCDRAVYAQDQGPGLPPASLLSAYGFAGGAQKFEHQLDLHTALPAGRTLPNTTLSACAPARTKSVADPSARIHPASSVLTAPPSPLSHRPAPQARDSAAPTNSTNSSGNSVRLSILPAPGSSTQERHDGGRPSKDQVAAAAASHPRPPTYGSP